MRKPFLGCDLHPAEIDLLTSPLVSFACLIVRFDQALFGNFHFANMDEEAIFLPTKAKIQLEIVAVAASAKERFNPNAIANLNEVATFE
jgi:hypothetical protein